MLKDTGASMLKSEYIFVVMEEMPLLAFMRSLNAKTSSTSPKTPKCAPRDPWSAAILECIVEALGAIQTRLESFGIPDAEVVSTKDSSSAVEPVSLSLLPKRIEVLDLRGCMGGATRPVTPSNMQHPWSE